MDAILLPTRGKRRKGKGLKKPRSRKAASSDGTAREPKGQEFGQSLFWAQARMGERTRKPHS